MPLSIRFGFIASVGLLVAVRFKNVSACGFDRCAPTIRDGINVHMVSHSHNDVGWVKTVNQYYYDQVQNIIDTVIDALLVNPHRKFTQVETVFLYIWWMKQREQNTEGRRNQLLRLIETGQMEIAGGAWSMNDEATVYYQSIIDGFTLGLRFLNDTLGPCAMPMVGWQVDSFGHSRQMASLFAEMGYKALFLGRLDHRDKHFRLINRQMEMIWRGHLSLGNTSDIFTSVLYNLYHPPEGFCMDRACSNRINSNNEQTMAREFVKSIEKMSNAYKSNNVLVTMGGDFTYTLADVYFSQIEHLMSAIKQYTPYTSDRKNINIFYSTPACYYSAILAESPSLDFKIDDFFPYADRRHSYWTGFYTSRPTSKRYEREGNNLLQVSKQLSVQAPIGRKSDLFQLSNAMGIMQHHDAITGTEKQYVADDYARLLHDGMQNAIRENGKRIKYLYQRIGDWNGDLLNCQLANMTICAPGQERRFAVVLYNPLGYSVSHHVRIPVAHTHYIIRKSLTEKVPYQISTPLRQFHTTHQGESLPYELTFLAKSIPALGVKQFIVSIDEQGGDKLLQSRVVQPRNYLSLGVKNFGLLVDQYCNVRSLHDGYQQIEIEQKLMYYNSKYILDRNSGRPSGAYIFAPYGEAKSFSQMNCSISIGPIFDEIRQEYEPWAGQIIRIYKDSHKYIEYDWTIGRIELNNLQGKEVISRFKTNLLSGTSFRTDTNGRSHIIRQRNHRDSYHYDGDDPISSNYYPLTSYIGIEDLLNGKFLTVFTDRSQGGTSLASGELEIMLHRRLVQDDSLGVDEVLNESDLFMGGVARGQSRISFGALERRDDETASRELILQPWMFLIPVDVDDINVWNLISKDYFGLIRELPKDVHLLSLEPWKGWQNKILIRFEHINEHGFPVWLDLQNYFVAFKIQNLRETTLGANQWKSVGTRKVRHGKQHSSFNHRNSINTEGIDNLQIILKPLEIRTFIATIKYHD